MPRRMVLGLALCAWLVCFEVLATSANWLPFAFAGLALTLLAFWSRAVLVAWVRPSLVHVGAGLLLGALMVLLTHAAFAALVAVVPGARPATRELFVLLNAAGFSPTQRAMLIVLVASCEEALFRAPLLQGGGAGTEPRSRRLARAQLAEIIGLACLYALTTAPLGNLLLVVCAFLCGCVWGALVVRGRSLIVPIGAHVVWDLGVLLLWPLPTGH